MPTFLVELNDGRKFEVEADRQPTPDEVVAALNPQQQPSVEQLTQSYASSLANSAARGATRVAADLFGGVGYITGSETLQRAGDSIESGINNTFPINPLHQNDFGVKAAGAVGQAASMLATAGGGGALARIAGGTVQTGAALAALSAGGLAGARQGGQTADELGITGLDKAAMVAGFAGAEVLAETVPFGLGSETRALRRLLGDTIEGGTFEFAKDVGREAVEEGLTQIAQNALTIGLAPKGAKTPTLFQDVGESMALGAVGGGVFGLFNAAIPNPSAKPVGQPQTTNPTSNENGIPSQEGRQGQGRPERLLNPATGAANAPLPSTPHVDIVANVPFVFDGKQWGRMPDPSVENVTAPVVPLNPNDPVEGEMIVQLESRRKARERQQEAAKQPTSSPVQQAAPTTVESPEIVTARANLRAALAAAKASADSGVVSMELEHRANEAQRTLDALLGTTSSPTPQQSASQDVTIANIDDLVKNGGGVVGVQQGDRAVNFKQFGITIDGNIAEVAFVELDPSERGKGVGMQAYIALGNELAKRGITLQSSKSQYQNGRAMWTKLAANGHAVPMGQGVFAFVPSQSANTSIQPPSSEPAQAKPAPPKSTKDTLIDPTETDVITMLKGEIGRVGQVNDGPEWDWYRRLQTEAAASTLKPQSAEAAARRGEVDDPAALLAWVNANIVDDANGRKIDEAQADLANLPHQTLDFADGLGSAILDAIDKRAKARQQGSVDDHMAKLEADTIAKEQQQDREFLTLAAKSAGTAMTGSVLSQQVAVGSTVRIGGNDFTVTEFDDGNGTVQISSPTFGAQTIEADDVLPIEQVDETPFPLGEATSDESQSWADRVIADSQSTPFIGFDPKLMAAYTIKGARLIKEGLTTFAKWSAEMLKRFGEAVRDYLQGAWQAARKTSRVGAINPSGRTGRAQPLTEPVLTTAGEKPMGEIAVGDALASTDVGESVVKAIYPQGEKRVYKITLEDGRIVRATEEHLWHCRTNGREHTFRTWEIAALMQSGAVELPVAA